MLCFSSQKTAYEMRISDWSSDVCSSDLSVDFIERSHNILIGQKAHVPCDEREAILLQIDESARQLAHRIAGLWEKLDIGYRSEERRVGKSVSVRVDLGGRRSLNKKNKSTH